MRDGDYEAFRASFDYDPETGNIYWKIGCCKGSIAGGKGDRGYWVIRFRKRTIKAHRIAWLHFYGSVPVKPFEIDHINGDKSDNRIVNLRQCVRSQNISNASKIRTNNTSGCPGVHWFKRDQRYAANIKANGQLIFLGYFDTFDEAKSARIAAVKKYHGEFGKVFE